MLFFLSCPRCKQWIEVDRDWAGTLTACPLCAAQFLVPDAPVQQAAAPRAAGSHTDLQRADLPYSAPAPAVPKPKKRWYEEDSGEDEEDPASEYGDQRDPEFEPDINIALSAPVPPQEWNTVRVGLTMIQITMVVAVFCLPIMFLLGLAQDGPRGLDGRRDFLHFDSAMTCLGLLLLGDFLVGFIGQCMCCAVPEQARLRGRVAGSILCTVAAAILGVLLVIWFSSRGFRGGLNVGGELVTLLIPIFILGVWLAGMILWVLFLKGVGLYFHNESLAQSAQMFVAIFIAGFVTLFCLQAFAGALRDESLSRLGMLLQIVFYIVFFVWMLVLVVRARNTLAGYPRH